MNRKIDWVAVHPMNSNDEAPGRFAGEWFKRDVGVLAQEAERNHAKLSDYASRMNALRRRED